MQNKFWFTTMILMLEKIFQTNTISKKNDQHLPHSVNTNVNLRRGWGEDQH